MFRLINKSNTINYLLQDYHPDSITITDKNHKEGAYLQKSYTIRDNGKLIHGKLRVLGNVMQFIEYAGRSEVHKDEFLKNFDQLHPFPTVQKEVKMSNNTFSTHLTKAGFKKREVKTNYKYRNTNEYVINDTEHSITYHVLVKDYLPWAFSQKSSTEQLNNQISWPDEELNAKVDTVYDLTSKHPTLNFDIYYPTSENRFVGKTMIIGKSIVVASTTYPNMAHEAYQNLSFFDSLAFFINDSIALNAVNIPLLKNELMVNGEAAIEQLINRHHFDESTLNAILEWPINFWNSFDIKGSLRGTVLVELRGKNIETDVLSYWKAQVTPDNYFLTLATLHILQNENRAEDFIYVVEEAKRKGYDQVLWMDAFEHKYVQECGTMNIFFIIGDTAITPGLESGTILGGVTRNSTIQLLEEMGLTVEERDLSIDEIVNAHKEGTLKEVFGTGTAVTISMVKELRYKDYIMEFDVDSWKVAPEVKNKMDAIKDGSAEDRFNWMTVI